MSDAIKHECGIAHIRLLKPLEFYKKKYGTAFYGINKMYLIMEKQHNRGQDGAGFASIKLDMQPGERYISRVRSVAQQPIQDIFKTIREINANNTSVLLVEQNAQQALQRAHRAYVLEIGKVVKEAKASDLLNDPAVRAAYLGTGAH